MCEYTQKTWTLYLREKDDFINAFQIWLPRVKAELRCFMKLLQTDGKRKFISKKLRFFYKKRNIAIRYATLYIHEKNGLAKQGWRIIMTMKDLMLIHSSFLNNFWVEAIETANYLQNRLLIRNKSHSKNLPEESWIKKKQNLQHVSIFGSLALSYILDKKRNKSHYQKVWQDILIGYN